jgi:uncharacterized repeat protein (TIGR03803 family)
MKDSSTSETTRNITLLALTAILLLVSTTASSQATYTVLYKFQNSDPHYPTWTGLFAQGRDGNLYSTAQSGGENGYGGVFQLTPAGKMTVLYSLTRDDGAHPASGLTLGTDGSLYGTGSASGAGY